MKILRPTKTQWHDIMWWPSGSVVVVANSSKSDSELEALLECSKLHDDEFTSESAQDLNTIVMNPGERIMPPGRHSEGMLMEPDSKCVARKAKSIALRAQLAEAGLIQ